MKIKTSKSKFGFNIIVTAILQQLLNVVPLHAKAADNLPSEPLPPLESAIQPQSMSKLLPLSPDKRVGFIVVGLGRLSLEQILPAFNQCKLAKLSAVMTGDKKKGQRIASSYGLKESSIYGYDEWERLKNNNEVQAVYIVTPNGLHKTMVAQAAAINKHVLCEKPMATNSEDAKAMLEACAKTNVKLMIAYRCHYEPHHKALVELVKEGRLGRLKCIEAYNGQNQSSIDQWRHHKDLAGGGALPDVGIYCLNFARYMTGEEPSEVNAWMWSDANDVRFKEVEANVTWQMRFPSGIVAALGTSYDAYESRKACLHFEKGTVEFDPAFSYEGLRMKYIQRDPNNGEATFISEHVLNAKNQFALEIDHMAACLLNNTQPETPGEEGLKDQKIMEAIYKSAKENKPISL